MFKVSQEIRLNTSTAAILGQNEIAGSNDNDSNCSNPYNGCDALVEAAENVCIFGKYQRTPEADAYPTEPPHVYIAPELTDARKVQLLHFPSGALRPGTITTFVIKRNGVKGNFEVRLENPSGVHGMPLELLALDPERLQVECELPMAGLYKVHIKCNSVPLPKSPYIIVTMAGITVEEAGTTTTSASTLSFNSDASKVQSRGVGLTTINLLERNEFTVDGSAAGNNMLFVGILGPQGPCDEVVVKHLGRNISRVAYYVHDPGDYVLVVTWGDEHIPGSPFCLNAE